MLRTDPISFSSLIWIVSSLIFFDKNVHVIEVIEGLL